MAAIDLDPWGGETSRSANSALQPRKFTTYERDSNADDEAMHRRYSRRHGRFDQPDPWDGSYDLSDPQSFNRYAYVSNDPVNFTDPSGLFALPEREVRFGFEAWEDMRHLFDFYRTEFEPRGNGRLPRDIEPQETGQDNRTDCQRFADEVERIANDIFVNNRNSSTNSFPHNVNAFMDTLARRFTEVSSATAASLAILRYWSGPNPSTEFGTSGFARSFIDTEAGSNNQVRHATFGLIWGYSGLSLSRANDRENQDSASNRADIALNNLTVPMGERITGGIRGYSGELSARGLADWIRNNLCVP